MNGSSAVVDIQLKRGPAGLGFNIIGGVDQQCVVNDNGIYVAKIKEDGAAAEDGRLQEGDKILEINGNKLENLSHGQAVELFRAAGEDVLLRVQQKSPATANGPPSSPSDGHSSSTFGSLLGEVVFAIGAVGVLALAFFIMSKSRRAL